MPGVKEQLRRMELAGVCLMRVTTGYRISAFICSDDITY
jgi:hypothetical protein